MSGCKNQAGGRMGDGVSTLSQSLQELGFEIGRFKTGTPCRLNARSIDLSACETAGWGRAASAILLSPGSVGQRPG